LNGSTYSGDFLDNLKHGYGHEITNDHIYEGYFKNDKKEGDGKLTYKNTPDCYEGDFKDNLINGTGIYKWANGDIFHGTFKDGKMDGKGVYKWPDGGQYEGEYVNNLKEGFGIFTWSNGKIFKGFFKLGRPHGQGKMVSDTETFDVTFEEGIIVKSNKNSNAQIEKNKSSSDRSLNAHKLIISQSSINTKSTFKKDSTIQ
jgi:hypothetical protein